jgi:acyl-coenzyme A synthetase/AMP-(fatty) acid ligase
VRCRSSKAGRARRRAGPGLGHDRDQPGRHHARCRRRHPQGRLGRQGDDAHRDPHRRRRGQRRAAGRDRRAADQGPNITPGYWNKPEATAAAFTDGWLHTGDAARLDDEGFVYIVDRWKDMYISGGENVYPAEVENVLFQLPQVADAAIIGVPNERWGEVGMAIIVRNRVSRWRKAT